MHSNKPKILLVVSSLFKAEGQIALAISELFEEYEIYFFSTLELKYRFQEFEDVVKSVDVIHWLVNRSSVPQKALNVASSKKQIATIHHMCPQENEKLESARESTLIHVVAKEWKEFIEKEQSLEDINQIYNDISAKAIWSKNKKRYTNQASFNINLFDKLGENENTIHFLNTYGQKIKSNEFLIDFESTYTQLIEEADYNRFFINFKPHYKFRYKKVIIDLGVNTNYFLDSNTNQIYIAPYGMLETDIIPKKIRAYLSGSGDLKQNTLRSLSYENLFLGNNAIYSNPYVWTFNAGMNGTFNKIVQLGIDIKHELIEDQYFFVNDTNDLQNFVTISDDLNRTTLSGELKVDLNKKTTFNLIGNYYSYSTVKEKEAWHMPNYDISVFAKTHIGNKIYLTGSYFMTSTREAINLRNTQKTLDGINDINLAFEYRYKTNISGFLNINNILNQRYEMWNNYRSQGLNILAGVSFSL